MLYWLVKVSIPMMVVSVNYRYAIIGHSITEALYGNVFPTFLRYNVAIQIHADMQDANDLYLIRFSLLVKYNVLSHSDS